MRKSIGWIELAAFMVQVVNLAHQKIKRTWLERDYSSKEWDLNDEHMRQQLELPKKLDCFRELLKMDGSERTNELILTSFRWQVLELKGLGSFRHCSLDTSHDLQLVLVFTSLRTLQKIHFFLFIYYLNRLL